MSQVLTFLTSLFRRHGVRLSIRLDRTGVGAHLLWSITNTDAEPVTIVQLLFRDARGNVITVVLKPARTVAPGDTVLLGTDVDWNVLGAREIAAVIADGREHPAPRAQLAAIQERLRRSVDGRASPPSSAREFLAGAASFALGILIIGLGFFMLMWVIATG